MHTNYYGADMAKKTRHRFNLEFKVESAQLILDQAYSVREAADCYHKRSFAGAPASLGFTAGNS